MIIKSLLDTDLYKFTMAQAVLHQFPGVEVEYTFKNRGNEPLGQYVEEIEEEIKAYCQLRFTQDELMYLRTIPYLKSDFIDFLALFQPNMDYVDIFDQDDGSLNITIRGPWIHTIWFEVPILAIVSEVYNRHYEETHEINNSKLIKSITSKGWYAGGNRVVYSDFGTRRRFSFDRQLLVIDTILSQCRLFFQGTSNVYFAKKFDITPIGTMAHEWLQAGQQLGVRIVDSQKFMLENWVKEYRGSLGIALTDVIGIDAFLRDFDLYFAKLYDGVRHDSGDPLVFADKIIDHYRKLKINPMTKTIVFSDGLNMQTAAQLKKNLEGRIKVAFGIGTNLTNDSDFGHPLKIVMKMTRCNGQPVIKISDSPGKSMCDDQEYESYVRKVFNKL